MSQHLSDLLLRAAEAFKAECVHRAGPIHMFRNRVDYVAFPGPSLMPPSAPPQFDLTDLSKILYDQPDLGVGHALRVWELATELIWAKRQPNSVLTGLLNEVFPNIPFPAFYHDDIRIPLTSYLLACSWHFGSLRTTAKSIMLVIDDDRRIGFDQRLVQWVGGCRFARSQLSFNPKISLSMNMGKRIKGTTTTSSLYRFLIASLPDLITTIDHVFQVAVHAGRPYEEILSIPFDVESLRNVETIDENVWDEALRIVDSSFLKPYRKLMTLLVPSVMARTTFRRTFGEMSARSESFSHVDRARYRSIILAAQSASISKVKGAAVGEGRTQNRSEEDSLLDFQRLLGGSL